MVLFVLALHLLFHVAVVCGYDAAGQASLAVADVFFVAYHPDIPEIVVRDVGGQFLRPSNGCGGLGFVFILRC